MRKIFLFIFWAMIACSPLMAQTTITIPAIRDCVNCPGNPSTNGTGIVSAYTCNTASAGTLTVGTAVSGVTQTITATVTTVGTYNISAIANGVTFAATGTFTATGSQPIVLTATGTPLTNNTTTFVLNTTPNCYFNRTINGLGGPSPSGSCPTNLKFQYISNTYWGLTTDGDVYGWDNVLEGTVASGAAIVSGRPALGVVRSKTPSKVQFLPKIAKLEVITARKAANTSYRMEVVALGIDGNIYNTPGQDVLSPEMVVLGNASTGITFTPDDVLSTVRLPAPPTGSRWIDIGARLNTTGVNSVPTARHFIYALNNLGEMYYLDEPNYNNYTGGPPISSTWVIMPYPQGTAASFRYTEIPRSEVSYLTYSPAVVKGNDGFYYSFIATPANASEGLLGWGVAQADAAPPLISSMPAVNSSQIRKMQFPAGTVLKKISDDGKRAICYFTTDDQVYVTGRVGILGLIAANPSTMYYQHQFEDYTNISLLSATIAYTLVPKKIALPAGATKIYSYNYHMAITDIGSFNSGVSTYFSSKDNNFIGSNGPAALAQPSTTFNGVTIIGHTWTPVLPINDFSTYGKNLIYAYPAGADTPPPGIIRDRSTEKFMILGDDGTLYRVDKPGRMQYLINGNCDDSNGFPEPF
ncbi:MAG: hypothetical protein ACK4YV_07915 [Emticicia sp.]